MCVELSVPAYSRRAVDALGAMLEDNGEVLPLDSPTGEYFAYNCTTKVDVLNLRKSVLNRDDPEERSDDVRRFEFYKTRLKGLSIFRIPECPNQYMVTDIFKDRVEQAGLNGFVFTKLWPLDEGVYEKQMVPSINRFTLPFRAPTGNSGWTRRCHPSNA